MAYPHLSVQYLYNKVSEHLREKRREQANDPIDEVMESRFDRRGKWRQPPADIETEVFDREVCEMMQARLGRLSTSQRIAYYLREVKSPTAPELCKELGATVTNVGVPLYRAQPSARVRGEEGV